MVTMTSPIKLLFIMKIVHNKY